MGLWICQESTLDAVRPMGLRPHGDDEGFIRVARGVGG